MKKSILFFCLTFFICFIKAQKFFSTEYEARYTMDYKLLKSDKEPRLTTFILLMNENESYFKSMNVYVGDSLQYYKKIKKSGDALTDFKTISNYTSEFPENIGTTIGKFYVSTPVSSGFAFYEEQIILNGSY